MLEGVQEELIENQAARDRRLHAEVDVLPADSERDPAGRLPEGAEEKVGEASDIVGEVDPGEVARLIELLMNECHGANSILALGEELARLDVLDVSRLEFEQAGGHLQVVLDPVMDLLQQHLF